MGIVAGQIADTDVNGKGMTMEIALLIVGAGAFYVAAMVLMKYWGFIPPILMMMLVGGAFMLGAWCELEALKVERLSAVYIAILAVECTLVAVVSFAVIGEQVTIKEMAGGVLVLSGLALAAV